MAKQNRTADVADMKNDPPSAPDPATLEKVVDLANALVESKGKKPRTESPATIASRAFREREALFKKRARIVERHAADLVAVDKEIAAHAEKCKGLSAEARVLLEKWTGGE